MSRPLDNFVGGYIGRRESVLPEPGESCLDSPVDLGGEETYKMAKRYVEPDPAEED
ncbi:MAG: hypothetical protein ABIB79_04380 [archaeon]